MNRTIARLARMSGHEAGWRIRTAARRALQRATAAVREPRWVRPPDATGAHRAISEQIAASTRFPIVPARRADLVARIAREAPHAARHAAARADRVLFGDYDLLGYRGLRFDGSGRFEWARDPVHDRCAPARFWSTVPYLDPAIGDHKIIWELNRHQHWITLGRAYWLTGERRYRDRCLAELASWLDANPPLVGINWASMLELAIRSLSWLWALHFFADPDADDASPWTVDLLIGLDRQLTHIEQNLSHYFSPNTHLTGEALALYVAGRTLPQLERSTRRADTGRRVLVAEINRQIAPDGGHCERSVHYHRYTHDFYALALVIARITDDSIAPTFARALGRLAAATRALADDSGRLPHIGDDDGGVLLPLTGRAVDDVRDSLAVASALLDRPELQIGPPPEEVHWWLGHPAFANRSASQSAIRSPRSATASVALKETGYYISRGGDGTQLIVDGGPHGYQNCGHAHADALAITLTVRGVPLLIDPGAGVYTIDTALRDRLRSTALHNTVTVDDRSQSVPAGPFHWTRSTDASVARWRTNEAFDYFDGSHDGYHPTVHRRRVFALHQDLVLVADFLDGGASHAAWHWHLDPRWRVALADGGAILTGGSESAALFVVGAPLEAVHADPETGLGWYSPVYGRVEATHTLRAARDARTPCWVVTAIDLDRQNPITRVDTVPIWAEAGAIAHGTAVRIARGASIDYVMVVEPHATASGSWRVAEFETDARLFYCRTERERHLTRLAFVDGTFVKTGRGGQQITLPAVAPDYHLELPRDARRLGTSD